MFVMLRKANRSISPNNESEKAWFLRTTYIYIYKLNGYKYVLIGCKIDFNVSPLRINFFLTKTSLQLNAFFISTKVREILEGNIIRCN